MEALTDTPKKGGAMMENKTSGNGQAFAVLNPSGKERHVAPTPPAQRRGDLEGKVVYCISQHVGGASSFLKRVAEVLPQYIPGVIAKYMPKSTAYMTDDPELWDEIRAKGAAFIYGCGA
jgi:hypothetical protein